MSHHEDGAVILSPISTLSPPRGLQFAFGGVRLALKQIGFSVGYGSRERLAAIEVLRGQLSVLVVEIVLISGITEFLGFTVCSTYRRTQVCSGGISKCSISFRPRLVWHRRRRFVADSCVFSVSDAIGGRNFLLRLQ